jgi:hypothetical protein
MTALSKRGAQNVGTYIGHLPVSLIEVVDDSNWIDLSFAENYTIRKDVLEVFRDAAATQSVDKVSQTEVHLVAILLMFSLGSQLAARILGRSTTSHSSLFSLQFVLRPIRAFGEQ